MGDQSEVPLEQHLQQVTERPPRKVPFLPLPEVYYVGTANAPDDSAMYVTVTFETPNGEDMHFLPAERALNLAKMLQHHARNIMAYEASTAKLVDSQGKPLK